MKIRLRLTKQIRADFLRKRYISNGSESGETFPARSFAFVGPKVN